MSTHDLITVHLKVWRQNGPNDRGHFEDYTLKDITTHMSFLEMLDVLNENLMKEKKTPVEFDHDCREGICGSCNLVINGIPHGPQMRTAACQLHMRHFKDNETITIEPWRAKAFPIIKDLVVDRNAFDRIMEAGGYVTMATGNAPDANAVPISKVEADSAMDYAVCIGCGACVASCPNSSASLFTGAKIAQLAKLPQGAPERKKRVIAMVEQMEKEGFGDCSNYGECEAVCPVGISISAIATMRTEYVKALF
ncbi:MAG: succinate dehydrogenase/fumarate reductase iron-sulfur subunit [Candidatus Cyclonatronum sp.]|uniref:succinate dehydrogenase/fumarate reductase iron-sulfur subunit n=1 Tax=Cyclonatronum sp. TaxID=3024185 RepID=UPI0025BADE87|nr:succinate dehydrogenase/fumarate reductase iron-sulfur subunit [Cyclonatronum sp.]MCC5933927.1 succinate dehydrogenase/fumarate reductase iron-sulfur subunit [Balneolales bacterium]MCH8486275.1 succinate dehydrogenase/fumarate reductase iron-sulfur subunit [Cyclonatronum sp.]